MKRSESINTYQHGSVRCQHCGEILRKHSQRRPYKCRWAFKTCFTPWTEEDREEFASATKAAAADGGKCEFCRVDGTADYYEREAMIHQILMPAIYLGREEPLTESLAAAIQAVAKARYNAIMIELDGKDYHLGAVQAAGHLNRILDELYEIDHHIERVQQEQDAILQNDDIHQIQKTCDGCSKELNSQEVFAYFEKGQGWVYPEHRITLEQVGGVPLAMAYVCSRRCIETAEHKILQQAQEVLDTIRQHGTGTP